MMNRIFKKVTTMIAAAAIAFSTFAGSFAVMTTPVHAATFDGRFDLNTLPFHPTADMDIELIRSAYKQGRNLGGDLNPGDVVYVRSVPTDVSTPSGNDVVVVYKVYQSSGLFGIGSHWTMRCKSLTNGKVFELTIDSCGIYINELIKVDDTTQANLKIDENGLMTRWDSVVVPVTNAAMTIIKFFGLGK